MNKNTIEIATLVNKPKLDWLAMKIECFKRLDENNRIRDADAELRSIYPRIGDHIYRTVEKLISLYRKKFESGQLQGGNFKFTYSYFKRHAESKYVIKTLINHFNTLMLGFNSIFSKRQRDTIKLPNRDGCNCVLVEFAPGIVKYTNPKFDAIHNLPMYPVALRVDKTAAYKPAISPQALRSPEDRAGGVRRLGDSLGGLDGPLGAFFKGR